MAKKWSRPPRKEAEPPAQQMHLSEAFGVGPTRLYRWEEEETSSSTSVFDPEARLWEYVQAATSRRPPKTYMAKVRQKEISDQAKAFIDWLKYEVWGLPTEQERYQAAVAEFETTIRFLERVKIGEEETVTAMDLVRDPILSLSDLQKILGPLLATKHRYYTDRFSTEGIVITATDIAQAYQAAHEP